MTTSDQWKAFERAWADMVVDSVNHLRDAAGITVKDLAARLDAAGWPVSVATLSGILSGRKRGSISVTEWLAFAGALNVEPLYLAVGFPSYERAPASPMWAGKPLSVDGLAAWVTGDVQAFPNSHYAELNRFYGGTAAHNMVLHAVMMRRLEWQAAGIVARSEFPHDFDFQGVDVPLAARYEALRNTLSTLAGVRAEERSVDAQWRVRFEPLPEALTFLDDLSYRESMPGTFEVPDLSIHELRTFVSPEAIDDARSQIYSSIRATQLIRKREHLDGTPADPAE